jgi:hypothetical protein
MCFTLRLHMSAAPPRAGLTQALGRMQIQWRLLSSRWLLTLYCSFTAPAYATQQCPAEFGTKDPIVDQLGWAIVAIGVITGTLLLAFAIRRSAGMRWHYRFATILAGLFGLVLSSVGGLSLAIAFFLTC